MRDHRIEFTVGFVELPLVGFNDLCDVLLSLKDDSIVGIVRDGISALVCRE